MTGDDVALKILHTADWHLGRPFASFAEADRKKLMRARLTVVERILLGVAEANRVDAVLCAGDLFDEPRPDKIWWQGLRDILQRTEPTRPIFLLPGNHDPLTEQSVFGPRSAFRRDLPRWVHVVDRDDFEVELSEDAVLYAVPCRSQAGESDLALRLPDRKAGDERIRIGMVHGQTFDIEGYQTNFPIARDAPVRRGLDYLAIGDTHEHRLVPEDGPVPMVYPSTPEQCTFGEKNTGLVVLVFFRRRGRKPLLRTERVAQWRWRQQEITGLAELRALRSENLKQTVLRLSLRMAVTLDELAEVEALLAELKGTDAHHGRVGVLQVDRTGLTLDTREVEELFSDLPDVLQAAASKLRRQTALPEKREVAERALQHLYHLVRAGG